MWKPLASFVRCPENPNKTIKKMTPVRVLRNKQYLLIRCRCKAPTGVTIHREGHSLSTSYLYGDAVPFKTTPTKASKTSVREGLGNLLPSHYLQVELTQPCSGLRMWSDPTKMPVFKENLLYTSFSFNQC